MQVMKLHLGLWKSWIRDNQRVLGRRLHKKIKLIEKLPYKQQLANLEQKYKT